MKLAYRQLLGALLLFAVLVPFVFSCKKESAHYDRPQDPWVFRSVLDSIPRIATVGLHDDMWVAYNTATCAIYKAWSGSVNFDGAVYTTVHGPQPSSIGNGWFVNKHENPWLVVQGGKEESPKVQYRGHRFVDGQVTLNYELQLADGKIIKVSERPEYATKGEAPNGQVGLERVFTTSDVPEGAQVVLKTNLSSISLESAVETDGEWKIDNKANREFNGLSGLDLDGKLALKSNGSTRFAVFFTKKPMIENPNKIEGDEEAERLPLGLRLIGKSDCKSCHNPTVQTVGPAYVDIATRYRNTADNVATLVAKVKNGGAGNWGQAAMTAHADLPDSDVEIMVKYIMGLDSAEESKLAALPENQVNTTALEPFTGVKEEDIYPGAIIKVYQFVDKRKLTKVADMKPLPKPIYVGVQPKLHATAADFGDLTDNFGIIAEGFLKIPKDNTYTFRTISDDGSMLYIGTTKVVDNDGLHGDEPKDGDVVLKAGLHPFRLEYFEAGGGNVISLQWKTPDGKFEVVPNAILAHDKNQQPTSSGGNISFGAGSQIPGDKAHEAGVHPSYDLAQARPNDFLPKVGGMDFLSDGRLVVSTWDAEGGVYIVENAQSGDPAKMKAKKIGNGLAEPLGLKVVNDVIYVLQKQELTKLVDNDKDGLIDEYYTVCNSWGVSSNFHEFAFGLVYKDGYFYGSLATDILPGGAGAPTQPKDRGRTFKISEKDGSIEFIASGLRTPNGIGIGVDGEIFNADNQGDWLPSSKILHITPGAFFGSRAVDFEGTANLPVKQPVVWLPQDEIGNSPSTPLAFTDDSPYKGQLMHGEVTHGGVKRVFVEKINGEYQGCVFRFTQGLEAGVNRMVWGPDGALYVGCIGNPGNWRDMNGEKLWYGLQRLKYNGKPTFEMLAIRAKSNGVEIEFTEPLEEGDGWNTAEYQVEQWRYVPTKEYGGPKVDQGKLKVLSASVSGDRKKIFLELAGMKAGHVVYVRLPYQWVSANGNELWATEGWYTLNAIPANAPGEKYSLPPQGGFNTLTDAEKAAGWKLLFDGKTTAGWHGFNKKPVSKKWVIEDGTLHFNPKAAVDEKNGDIITDEEFANYELRLEWKVAPCGNSGVIYNVVEDPTKYEWCWQTGPEMQILDNACHPDAMFDKHKAGDLYDMIACRLMTVKPGGQWNRARLINRNGKVEHWLNGRKVVEVDMTGDAWRKLIAGSKFKDMPDFGKKTSGRIALQDHGNDVWFRNVKVRALK